MSAVPALHASRNDPVVSLHKEQIRQLTLGFRTAHGPKLAAEALWLATLQISRLTVDAAEIADVHSPLRSISRFR